MRSLGPYLPPFRVEVGLVPGGTLGGDLPRPLAAPALSPVVSRLAGGGPSSCPPCADFLHLLGWEDQCLPPGPSLPTVFLYPAAAQDQLCRVSRREPGKAPLPASARGGATAGLPLWAPLVSRTLVFALALTMLPSSPSQPPRSLPPAPALVESSGTGPGPLFCSGALYR